MATLQQTSLASDLYVQGNLSAKTFTPPQGCITDNAILGAAGILASKLQHQYQPIFAQVSGSNATAETRVLWVVYGTTATIQAFKCGNVVAATGNSTVTIDLKKNGTTVLTATTVLDNTNTAYSLENAAGFTSTSLVAGDVLTIVQTVSAGSGTLPQGVFAQLTLREDAQ